MAELVFCFGAGKYNDVEMVLVIIGDTNKDKVYKQEELVTAWEESKVTMLVYQKQIFDVINKNE